MFCKYGWDNIAQENYWCNVGWEHTGILSQENRLFQICLVACFLTGFNITEQPWLFLFSVGSVAHLWLAGQQWTGANIDLNIAIFPLKTCCLRHYKETWNTSVLRTDVWFLFLCLLEKITFYDCFLAFCMKRITLCSWLCSSSSPSSRFSASRIRNIGSRGIWDFGTCHNVKSHVCWDFLSPSESGFSHFKEQLKSQVRVALRKKLFVILYSPKVIPTFNFIIVNK